MAHKEILSGAPFLRRLRMAASKDAEYYEVIVLPKQERENI